MTDEANTSITFRQILVAVDTSEHSRAALEAAAALARMMEAEIRALFVREEHWNRISRLPSRKVINEFTGRARALEEQSLNRQIEVLMSRLRNEIRHIGSQHDIAHSLETAQGQVADKILESAQSADLITIGRRGRSFGAHKKLGSTARKVIRKSDKPVLILQKGLQLGKTITVVYDASVQSQRGLQLALTLAQRNKSRLAIIAVDSDREHPSGRNRSPEKLVDDAEVPVRVTLLDQAGIGQLIHTLNHQHAGLLIMPKSSRFLQDDALETTLEHLNMPVLLI